MLLRWFSILALAARMLTGGDSVALAASALPALALAAPTLVLPASAVPTLGVPAPAPAVPILAKPASAVPTLAMLALAASTPTLAMPVPAPAVLTLAVPVPPAPTLAMPLAMPLAAPPPASAAPKLDSELVNFFVGEWKGAGHFSNGKPIASTLSFHLSLDSAWLVFEHRDIPPMNYKATGWWGVDANTKQFVAIVFDNFQGHRSFASRGWSGGRLILTTQSYAPGVGTYFEHFIYERISDSQFKMTYETSADAITWQLGDSLVYTRA